MIMSPQDFDVPTPDCTMMTREKGRPKPFSATSARLSPASFATLQAPAIRAQDARQGRKDGLPLMDQTAVLAVINSQHFHA